MRYPALKFMALLLPALLLLAPYAAQAQVVRGQLLNGETGLPLEGAMIVLQGSGGELGAVMSNATGRFLIQAPVPGSYTLRADRIGHASTTSDPFFLAAGDTVDIRMVAEVRAIKLEGLEISGERRCEIRPEAGRAVATVWEEARKALAAAVLTEASGLYRYRTIRFLRELDKEGRRVLSEQRRVSQQFQLTPFESLPAETLMTEGFIRPDPDGDLYFAPDAKVLLSDPFLDTHCLTLTAGRGESAGLLGVGFEPLGGRELPDIRGVVWVDPATGELRYVDYTYENLDPALRSDAVGGRVAFQGLPNGSWIVTEWRIRMPSAALSPDFRGGRQLVLAGVREVGGEVDRVQDQEGNTILEAERATLAGVVLDSTGVAPLAGATVTLVGTQASAVTDSAGSFNLPGLSEGVYSVTFSHPTVPPLGGLPEPVEVELVTGMMASVRMVAPPLSLLLEAACGDTERPEESAVLTGLVTDQETGEPLPGAVVRVLWTDYRFRGTAVARAGGAEIQALLGMQEDGLQGHADESGRYLACGVPVDHPLTVEAETGDLTSGILAVRVPPETQLFDQDLGVVRSGTGTLVGIAVAWEDQGPLEGVRVTFEDLDIVTLSDENGHFLLGEIPLGRHALRAEMLGRRTVTDTVRIRPDRPLQMEIRLPPEAFAIEGITVEVLSRAQLEIRSEGLPGATLDRLTPEEMDDLRDNVSGIVDVIHRMGSPRIRITEWGPQGFPLGFCMTWRRSRPPSLIEVLTEEVEGLAAGVSGGCQSMLIVVDGQPIQGGPQLPASAIVLEMGPEDIESVRVLSPVQAQFRYGIQGGNGALVIETRRGARGGK
jgi:protocatechuate 3,4-dioxygenase beta subunit